MQRLLREIHGAPRLLLLLSRYNMKFGIVCVVLSVAANAFAATDSTRVSKLVPAFTRVHSADTLHTSETSGQQILPLKPQIDWTRFSIASGSLAAGIFALHVYQLNAWWANQRTTFHVIDDNEYK